MEPFFETAHRLLNMAHGNAGFMISKKSVGHPLQKLTFLRKNLDFSEGCITNTRRCLEDALTRYVVLPCEPLG